MGRRAWVDVKELKRHVDLTKLVGSNKVLCPWHDDHTPSLHVYPDHVYCFSCGAYADVLRFVRTFYKLSFEEALDFLLEHQEAERIESEPAPLDERKLLLFHQQLVNFYPHGIAWDWLLARGLEKETIECLRIGWTGRAYTIPHFANNELVNCKYRIHPAYHTEKQPKYWALANRTFDYLYPWDVFRERHGNSKALFLTEGELDAALLLQHNLPSLSLPSGAGTSWKPWLSFFNRFKCVYLLYDQDEAGRGAVRRLFSERVLMDKTVVELLDETEICCLTWDIEWGKDVTDAREYLIPKLEALWKRHSRLADSGR